MMIPNDWFVSKKVFQFRELQLQCTFLRLISLTELRASPQMVCPIVEGINIVAIYRRLVFTRLTCIASVLN